MTHSSFLTSTKKSISSVASCLQNGQAIAFRQDIDQDLADILDGLLMVDQKRRLTLKQIFDHPWVLKKAKLSNTNIQEFVDHNHFYLKRDLSLSAIRSQNRSNSYMPDDFIENRDNNSKKGRLTEGNLHQGQSRTRDTFTYDEVRVPVYTNK